MDEGGGLLTVNKDVMSGGFAGGEAGGEEVALGIVGDGLLGYVVAGCLGRSTTLSRCVSRIAVVVFDAGNHQAFGESTVLERVSSATMMLNVWNRELASTATVLMIV